MYRKISMYLDEWKNSPHRKPLILQGARQVGKTFTVLEFGRTRYDNVAYFNFEMNPFGASYLGFGHGRNDLVRLHPGNVRELFNIRTSIDDSSWTLQYDIPHSFIRLFIPEFDPVSGHRMRANFYKCGDDIQPEHELMWNPITNGNADFHQPEFFGELVLE